jgi:predicted site-specific integrase-resolvase
MGSRRCFESLQKSHDLKNQIEFYGTEIIIVSNEKTSPEKELIDDLISIIHVFSCRTNGLRKYKKKIKEDEEI